MKYHNDITQRMGDVLIKIRLESNSEETLKDISNQLYIKLMEMMSIALLEKQGKTN